MILALKGLKPFIFFIKWFTNPKKKFGWPFSLLRLQIFANQFCFTNSNPDVVGTCGKPVGEVILLDDTLFTGLFFTSVSTVGKTWGCSINKVIIGVVLEPCHTRKVLYSFVQWVKFFKAPRLPLAIANRFSDTATTNCFRMSIKFMMMYHFLMLWCSGYHYCKSSFSKVWTLFPRRFKASSRHARFVMVKVSENGSWMEIRCECFKWQLKPYEGIYIHWLFLEYNGWLLMGWLAWCHDHVRDVSWEDVFKCGVSLAESAWTGRIQVGVDVIGIRNIRF